MSDVSFIQAGADGAAVQDIVDAAGGHMVAGRIRLAQRVMLELLTIQGSLPYLETRGTMFLALLQAHAYSEMDVLAAFAASKPALYKNLRGEELPSDPLSEQYADSEVTQLTVMPGVVSMTLAISSRAGITTALTMPVLVFTA